MSVNAVIPPRERTIASRMIADFKRVRAKSGKALIRTVLLRSWPISIPVRYHYRQRLRPERREKINRRSKQFFAQHSTPLDEYQRLAIEELRNDGIHVSHVNDLLPGVMPLHELQEEAERLIKRPEIQSQIIRRRSKDGAKWYVIRAFGLRPTLAVTKQLAEVFLNERLLLIVNSYLGLCCRLMYLDVWYNLSINGSEPGIDSEYWHRDNHDKNIVKLYVYLDDVDEHRGPFNFLRRTQAGGEYGSVFPAYPPEGSYPSESALMKIVPENQILRCTGPAGTVILCDTSGFHMGGRCTRKRRFLLTATYVSDAGFHHLRYRLKQQEQYAHLGPMAKYAIRASF